jgi:hypothetical protein
MKHVYKIKLLVLFILTVCWVAEGSLLAQELEEPWAQLEQEFKDGSIALVVGNDLDDIPSMLVGIDNREVELKAAINSLMASVWQDSNQPMTPQTLFNFMRENVASVELFQIYQLVLAHHFLQRQRLELQLQLTINSAENDAVVSTARTAQRMNQVAMIIEVNRFLGFARQMEQADSSKFIKEFLYRCGGSALLFTFHLREMAGYITQHKGQRSFHESLPHHAGPEGKSLLVALEEAKTLIVGGDGAKALAATSADETRAALASALDGEQIVYPQRRTVLTHRGEPVSSYHGQVALVFGVSEMAERQLARFRSEAQPVLAHLEEMATAGNRDARALADILQDAVGPHHMVDSSQPNAKARWRASLMWKNMQIEGVLQNFERVVPYSDDLERIRVTILPQLRQRHARINRFMRGEIPKSPKWASFHAVSVLGEIALVGAGFSWILGEVFEAGEWQAAEANRSEEFDSIDRAFANLGRTTVEKVNSHYQKARSAVTTNYPLLQELYGVALPQIPEPVTVQDYLTELLLD